MNEANKKNNLAPIEDNFSKLLLKDPQHHAIRCWTIGIRSYRTLGLELFKNGLRICPMTSVYQRHQHKVRTYRLLFLAFALLFLGLTIFSSFQKITITTTLFGTFPLLPKGIICSCALTLSIVASTMAFRLSISKEATYKMILKAKSQLANIYQEKCLESRTQDVGISGFSRFFKKKNTRLHKYYQEAIEVLEDQREEAIILLNEIQNSKEISQRDKELLFSQALDEMQNYFREIIDGFNERVQKNDNNDGTSFSAASLL